MRDEPDNWSVPGTPLPPDDRLWRHPSEVAHPPPPAPPATGPRRSHRRALVAVALLSGFTGAAATLVSLAALGTLSPRTVERVERVRGTAGVPSTTVRALGAAAASVGPAVVEVSVVTADGRRRGSGVVVGSDGLILTSAQVLDRAGAVTVTWASGRSAPAVFSGFDELTGLALLTVAAPDLATAAVDTTLLRPGDPVSTVAGGDPRTGGPAITATEVTAVGSHADPERGRLLGLVETDRPVPAEADGGALVDDEGRVRGISLRVPGSTAAGWAVPIESALRVARDLQALGRVDRGWLGLSGRAGDPDGAAPAGVVLDVVMEASPADRAGIRPGDVVVSVAGHRTRSLADVRVALALTRPGDEIVVACHRDGTTTSLTVPLASIPG